MLYFPNNWQQYQQFPLGPEAIRALLTNKQQKRMPGPLLRAIQDRHLQVTVLAGVHQGGAPGAKAQDPRLHLTLLFEQKVFHVQVTENRGIYDVTSN